MRLKQFHQIGPCDRYYSNPQDSDRTIDALRQSVLDFFGDRDVSLIDAWRFIDVYPVDAWRSIYLGAAADKAMDQIWIALPFATNDEWTAFLAEHGKGQTGIGFYQLMVAMSDKHELLLAIRRVFGKRRAVRNMTQPHARRFAKHCDATWSAWQADLPAWRAKA